MTPTVARFRTPIAVLTAAALSLLGVTSAAAAGPDGALDASDLGPGAYAFDTVVGDFTLRATAAKGVTVDASDRLSDRGDVYTQRVKLNGSGDAAQRSVAFTADGPAEVIVHARRLERHRGPRPRAVRRGGHGGRPRPRARRRRRRPDRDRDPRRSRRGRVLDRLALVRRQRVLPAGSAPMRRWTAPRGPTSLHRLSTPSCSTPTTRPACSSPPRASSAPTAPTSPAPP
ncbi:hypothetical protein [Demequina litorisediminis]|uniref:hypothetical protein n=1 Tax=Demequina litorisediminis TaxID=1849022 RepID=UPI0024E10FBD|nr:hypothetical protein [Demequina litorisediminis]